MVNQESDASQTHLLSQEDDRQLCDSCHSIDLRKLLKTEGQVNFGHIENVSERSHCSFCKLITLLVYKEWLRVSRPTPKEMNQSGVGHCFVTVGDNRIGVSVPLPVTSIGAGPGQVLSRSAHLVAQDAALLGLELVQSGRILGSAVDLDLVRSWIDGCNEQHDKICIVTPGRSGAFARNLRVIDVRRKCITLAEEGCRYIALSYVWGGIQMLSLGTQNRTRMEEEGALLEEAESVPSVVKDAMQLVAGLGERYLWIDALCILQDDPEQKHQQISQMAAVYQNSYLTLIAHSSRHANDGLAGVDRRPRRTSQRVFHLQGLRFVDALSILPNDRTSYVWDSRAWTYQEEYLSRRRLYLTDEGANFECQKWNVHDDVHLIKSPRIDTLSKPRVDSVDPEIPGYTSPKMALFPKYADQVTAYSRRQLSYPSDILNAFAGIAAVWKDALGWELIEGLPALALEYALHWRPAQLCRRRTWSSTDAATPRQVPSWSWAGWIGQVFYGSIGPNNTRSETTLTRLLPNCQLRGDQKPVTAVEIRSAVASFQVSNRQVFLAVTPVSSLVSVSLGIHDASGRRCGIARGLSLPSIEEDQAEEEAQRPHQYDLVLLSRSNSFPTRSSFMLEARWLTLGAHEDARNHLGRLRADVEWPPLGSDAEFDLACFPDEEWKALNVLILKRKGEEEKEGYERVGIGIIHEDAWKAASPEERTILVV
ncbi:MAG: hypothetical protein M1815_004884 [Lichina confinis]|nr:MAG: hypothetical protein M1815_004884 [Lichina confinis]